MATCAACGEEIKGKPVWVLLGDKGWRNPKEAFALHEKHYPKDGLVPAKRKIGEEEDGTYIYEDYMAQRYVKVDEPNG